METNKLAELVKSDTKTKTIASLVVLLLVFIPLLGIYFTSSIISGVIIGGSATVQTLPVICKAPPNIFDAWGTVENFLAGEDCNQCPTSDAANAAGEANKSTYVKAIIGTGNAMNVPEKGIIIALITAIQESGIKNYANDGEYNVLKNRADATLGSSSQATAILSFSKRSTSYPYDAIGSDATSVGLFQQQAWWGTMGGSNWETDPEGTMKRLMDPVFGSQKFYNKLLTVSGWESLEYGVAAQTVQVSAEPDAYSNHVSEAQTLYNQYKDSATSVTLYDFGSKFEGAAKETSSDSGNCNSVTTGIPMQKSAMYMISSQFAAPRGIPHNGLDITCHQYENVHAPISGTVTISVEGNSSGVGEPAGRVHIKTPDGSVFWFWHMRKTFVKVGDQVSGGQAIGECASTGNSSGNHLHITAAVENSNNPQIKALPTAQTDLPGQITDAALALDILGVDICPPYVANRKVSPVGSSIPPGTPYMVCWPQKEWK